MAHLPWQRAALVLAMLLGQSFLLGVGSASLQEHVCRNRCSVVG